MRMRRKPNWLLIKEHDEFERRQSDPSITEEAPNSVVTGRSLEEIAQSEDHVWNSKDTAKGKAWYRKDRAVATKTSSARVPASRKRVPDFASMLKKAAKEKLPGFIAPELALQSDIAPEWRRVAA